MMSGNIYFIITILLPLITAVSKVVFSICHGHSSLQRTFSHLFCERWSLTHMSVKNLTTFSSAVLGSDPCSTCYCNVKICAGNITMMKRYLRIAGFRGRLRVWIWYRKEEKEEKEKGITKENVRNNLKKKNYKIRNKYEVGKRMKEHLKQRARTIIFNTDN